MKIVNNCFCGGTTKLSRYQDQFFSNPLLVCNECGTLLINIVPTVSELREFYSCCYSVDRNRSVNESYAEVMRRRAIAQSDFLCKYLNIINADILDYGCGYGALLDALRAGGANTFGFDYDPLSQAALIKQGHAIVEYNVFESERKWDAVCLSHVLEHLPSPLEFLSRIRDRSRFIFIEIPKYDVSIREQFIDLEGHLWFFTERGLTELVEQSGLCIEGLICVGPDMRLFWSGSWIARGVRKVWQAITDDLFFNQYNKLGNNRMWLRIIASGKIK